VPAKSVMIAACMWVAKQAMTNGPDIHSSTHDLWELAPTDIQAPTTSAPDTNPLELACQQRRSVRHHPY
jgi:hypothetical protein